MVRLKSCPRCNGDMVLENDQYGWHEQCFQCGCMRSIEELREKVLPILETNRKMIKSIPHK